MLFRSVHILTEPKNALIKQYIKLFEMDNVTLEFEKYALLELANLAIIRKTGARGLRSSFIPLISSVSLSIPFCRLLMFQRVSSTFSFVQSAVFLFSSSSASATLICPSMSPRFIFSFEVCAIGCQW